MQYHSLHHHHHHSQPSSTYQHPKLVNFFESMSTGDTSLSTEDTSLSTRDTSNRHRYYSSYNRHAHPPHHVAHDRNSRPPQREHRPPPSPQQAIMSTSRPPIHCRRRLKPLPSQPLQRRAMGSSSLRRGDSSTHGGYPLSPLHVPQSWTQHVRSRAWKEIGTDETNHGL